MPSGCGTSCGSVEKGWLASLLMAYRTRMASRSVSLWLWLLLAAFVLRVLAQLLQWQIGLSFLPAFEAWQSGVLPYWGLLMAQLVIVLFLARVAWSFSAGTVTPSARSARLWFILGSVYLAVTVTRLGLGLTLLEGHAWFDRPLPSMFHIVLATFMIVAGLYHRANTRNA